MLYFSTIRTFINQASFEDKYSIIFRKKLVYIQTI